MRNTSEFSVIARHVYLSMLSIGGMIIDTFDHGREKQGGRREALEFEMSGTVLLGLSYLTYYSTLYPLSMYGWMDGWTAGA